MLETSPFAHGSARCDVAATVAPRTARLADFVAGEENRATLAAVEWLLDDTATAPVGPLVLYGPSGVGKTHLIRGLAAAWSMQRPDETIEVLTATEWSEAYAAAVDEQRIDAFRRRCRECDLLVIDELHRLGPKQAAQAELVQTLDVLEGRGAAVAVTLLNAPAKTDDLLPNLVARLSGGTVIEVAPQSPLTRRVILGEWVCWRSWTVELTALEMLADDRSQSVPEIIGTLTNWHQAADAEGIPLDAAFARKHHERPTNGIVPSLRTIAEQTARRFGLTLADLKSESRRRTIVAARDLAMLLTRRLTKKSLLDIGVYFGGRDHTTVMHSCRKAEEALDNDPETRSLFDELRKIILQHSAEQRPSG